MIDSCGMRAMNKNSERLVASTNHGDDTSLFEQMKTMMSSNYESMREHKKKTKNNNNSTVSSDERDDGRQIFNCPDALIR